MNNILFVGEHSRTFEVQWRFLFLYQKVKYKTQAEIIAIIGIAIVLLSAVALLWHGNANSMQATPVII